MELLFYLATACLLLFMVLATYDGFYLHLWKYRLFGRQESIFEHRTHTIRAVLFPIIVWLLFLNETSWYGFLIGLLMVIADLIVLAVDVYSEKESRSFMGGLPRWEYIIHLFSNAFHFTAIMLVIGLKLHLSGTAVHFVTETTATPPYELFMWLATNVIPGAVVLAFIHLALLFKKPQMIWNQYRNKITCC